MTLKADPHIGFGHMSRCAAEPTARKWSLADTEADLEPGWVSLPGGSLVEEGAVTRIATEARAVWVWLADGYDWREWAPRVDAAVRTLGANDLQIDPAADEILRLVAADAIHGELADFIASHGGQVEIVGVAGGTVSVKFAGACSHCPLSDVTLNLRIDAALRARFPQLREVIDATGRDQPGIFAGLFKRRG